MTSESRLPLRFKRRTISPGWHIGVFIQRPILVIDLVKLRLEIAYVH